MDTEREEKKETPMQKLQRLAIIERDADPRNYGRLQRYYDKTGQSEIPWNLKRQAD